MIDHRIKTQKNNDWKAHRRHQQKQNQEQSRRKSVASVRAKVQQEKRKQAEARTKQRQAESKQRLAHWIDSIWSQHEQRQRLARVAGEQKKKLSILLYKARKMHLQIPECLKGIHWTDQMDHRTFPLALLNTLVAELEPRVMAREKLLTPAGELFAAQWRQRQIEKVRAYRSGCDEILMAPGDSVPVVGLRHAKTGLWPISGDYPEALSQLIRELSALFLKALQARKIEGERVYSPQYSEVVIETRNGVYVQRTDRLRPMPVLGDVPRVERIRPPVRYVRNSEKRVASNARPVRVNRVRRVVEAAKVGEFDRPAVPKPVTEARKVNAVPFSLPVVKAAVSLIDQPKKDVIREAWEL